MGDSFQRAPLQKYLIINLDIKGHEVSQEVLTNHLRPTIPKNTPEQFAKLMKLCWEPVPSKRPNFKEIIKQLEAMKLPTS